MAKNLYNMDNYVVFTPLRRLNQEECDVCNVYEHGGNEKFIQSFDGSLKVRDNLRDLVVNRKKIINCVLEIV
jgi:hypothetical protein